MPAPTYLPEAIPTSFGWAHPLTGEQLEATTGLANPVAYYKPNASGGSFLAPVTGVGAVTIGNGGSGYTSAKVAFGAAPGGGRTARGYAVIVSGAISKIVITDAGVGYNSNPAVTITGDGTGATATCTRGSVEFLIFNTVKGKKVNFSVHTIRTDVIGVDWDFDHGDGLEGVGLNVAHTYPASDVPATFDVVATVSYGDPEDPDTEVLNLEVEVPATLPPVLPANTVAPAITGTAQAGQTLTTTNGTWTGTPTITYARQWRADGTNISGATGTTYVVQVGDVGKVISCRVTATNAAGSTAINSNNTSAVIAA